MAETALVGSELDEGERLVQALLDAGHPLVAAYWSYVADADEFRLFITDPTVDSNGPIAAYASLLSLMSSRKIAIPPHRISVISPREPFVAALLSAMRVEGIGRVRVRGSMFNGVHVEDALIYHLARSDRKDATRSFRAKKMKRQ